MTMIVEDIGMLKAAICQMDKQRFQPTRPVDQAGVVFEQAFNSVWAKAKGQGMEITHIGQSRLARRSATRGVKSRSQHSCRSRCHHHQWHIA